MIDQCPMCGGSPGQTSRPCAVCNPGGKKPQNLGKTAQDYAALTQRFNAALRDASDQVADYNDAMREETLDRDDWEDPYVPDASEL